MWYSNIRKSKGVLKDTSTKVLFHGAVATPPSTSRKAQDLTSKGVGESREKKKWQKPLDKPLKVWYNKDTKGESKAVPKRKDPRESVRPVLDEPTARCVGLRNTNVNQSRLAEEMTDYAYYKATQKGGGFVGVVLRPPPKLTIYHQVVFFIISFLLRRLQRGKLQAPPFFLKKIKKVLTIIQ